MTPQDQIGLPTGRIGFGRMLLATTAAEPYQATRAVTIPLATNDAQRGYSVPLI